MWTPLVGPVMAVCLAVAATPAFLYAYLIWVMLTRLLQSLALLTVRPTIDGLYPILIYYNQLYGAFLKTWILFRLDRQRWTRQNIALPARLRPAGAPARAGLGLPPRAGAGDARRRRRGLRRSTTRPAGGDLAAWF
jgi:hypothetical protein